MSTLAPPPSSEKPVPTGYERQGVAQTVPPPYSTTPGRRHFIIRRVHSLMGLVFGGYVTVHLLVNATGFWPKAYQQNVDHIHALSPMLPLIELTAIFIPLLVHLLYGVYITWAGVKFNTTKYAYGGNVRYTLQRWTAVILLLFLAFHIGTLHKWGLGAVNDVLMRMHANDPKYVSPLADYPLFNAENQAYQSTASALKYGWNMENRPMNMAIAAFYLLGIWSAVFHWANGLWTSAIAWGLTITAASQRRWGHVCLGFGILMLVIGTAAWAAFAVVGRPDLPEEQTHTLDYPESADVHGQATTGPGTPIVPGHESPVPVNR